MPRYCPRKWTSLKPGEYRISHLLLHSFVTIISRIFLCMAWDHWSWRDHGLTSASPTRSLLHYTTRGNRQHIFRAQRPPPTYFRIGVFPKADGPGFVALGGTFMLCEGYSESRGPPRNCCGPANDCRIRLGPEAGFLIVIGGCIAPRVLD